MMGWWDNIECTTPTDMVENVIFLWRPRMRGDVLTKCEMRVCPQILGTGRGELPLFPSPSQNKQLVWIITHEMKSASYKMAAFAVLSVLKKIPSCLSLPKTTCLMWSLWLLFCLLTGCKWRLPYSSAWSHLLQDYIKYWLIFQVCELQQAHNSSMRKVHSWKITSDLRLNILIVTFQQI